MTGRPSDSSDASGSRADPAPGRYPGPHRYPFRFIDRIDPASASGSDDGAEGAARSGSPTAGFSVGAVLGPIGRAEDVPGDRRPGPVGWSLSLLVEVMAQGALAALAGGDGAPDGGSLGRAPDGASLRLAGVDEARLHARVGPGDRLTIEATVEGRFAALAKVACRAFRGDELVAEARLLLAGDWTGA